MTTFLYIMMVNMVIKQDIHILIAVRITTVKSKKVQAQTYSK